MKKLHSIALFAMLTPVITLSSGIALAQQSAAQDLDREQQTTQQQSSQHQPGTAHSSAGTSQGSQSTQRPRQSDTQTAAERLVAGGQTRGENRGYLDAAPANGMHASNLMGAEVKTANDEDVGEVNDLIIDEEGQIVAIVISVGGFLGMGEKDVAIGWDDVTKTHTSDDDHELQISMTREGLRSAPEFKRNE